MVLTELAALFRHLIDNIVRAEDRFEIEPRRLDLEPIVDDVLQ